MSRSTVIRRVRFAAGHHYIRRDWSVERNREVFGARHEPHGHNYELEITVAGDIDPETGFLVNLSALDDMLEKEVVERLDQRSLNLAIPEIREGDMIPSTESLARWFWSLLEPRIPGEARLVRVRLYESSDLAAEFGEE